MPPVWLLMSLCMAYAASTHVKIFVKLVAPITLTSLMVSLHHIRSLLNFSQSSSSLSDTLLVRKLSAVSQSSLARFIMNNSFSATEWKTSLLLSSSCTAFGSTKFSLLVAGDVTEHSNYSPNIPQASSIWSFMEISIIFSLVIFIFMPRKLCVFPLVITSFPKCFSVVFKTLSTTLASTCESLLSSTYHTIVHCLSSIILLATHLSYGLIMNP